jgi:hypothetical protein
MGGGTVHQLIIKEMMANGRRQAYTLLDALDMCLQIAEGLNYLHTAHPMVRHKEVQTYVAATHDLKFAE